ncbi:MAG: glycosyltransferase [Anaerolineae bacterium]|nr:glycosyltransferase [Anaerolineae bacterium]
MLETLTPFPRVQHDSKTKTLDGLLLSAPDNHLPTVSVVIAWVNPLDLLLPVLEALDRQTRLPDEIIIVTRHSTASYSLLVERFPGVILVPAAARTPITRLRALGIESARSRVIAITEDHCVPSPDWVERIAAGLQDQSYAVIGGAVENACTTRLRDWAAFLTEYAGAVRSAHDNTVPQSIPGNNVAYQREVVAGLSNTLAQDRWESFYHTELDAKGAALHFDPDLVVQHRRPFEIGYFISQRFHFCRAFAGMRNKSLTATRRLFYGAACVMLPVLLWLRGLRILMQKGRLVSCYLVCSPLIVIYLTAGACGESIGYFFGAADSLEQVE